MPAGSILTKFILYLRYTFFLRYNLKLWNSFLCEFPSNLHFLIRFPMTLKCVSPEKRKEGKKDAHEATENGVKFQLRIWNHNVLSYSNQFFGPNLSLSLSLSHFCSLFLSLSLSSLSFSPVSLHEFFSLSP